MIVSGGSLHTLLITKYIEYNLAFSLLPVCHNDYNIRVTPICRVHITLNESLDSS